ncbi:hypothetical protein D3C78_838850 [compost metagenome]
MHLQRRLAKLGPLQGIDEECRVLPTLGALRQQLQLVVLITKADPDVRRQRLGQGAHPFGVGEVEAGRHGAVRVEPEGVVGQDADVAAGGEAQDPLEWLLFGVAQADGEADAFLIALGAEPGHLEVPGYGPVPLELGDGLVPQDLGRYAPFTRAVPIGLPA